MMVREGYKETELGLIPKNWKIVQTQEIGEIVTGTTPSTKDESNYGKSYPFITPTDISEKKYVNNPERYLTDKGYNASRPIPKDSLMVTCIASIGKNAITTKESCTNQQINSIICNDDIDVNFTYYMINYRREYLKALSGKTSVPIINKGEFSTFLLPLPPLPEQKKIANILSSVDKAIEKTDEIIAKTKELKKGLMQELLTRGTGHSEFKEVRIEPKLYSIPEKWRVISLEPKDSLTKKVTDGSHHSPKQSDDADYFYATVANLSDDGIDFTTCNKIDKQEYDKMVKRGCKPQIGDVLFSKDGTVGISAVFDLNKDVVLLSSIAIIRPSKNINSYYLKYFLSSKNLMNQIKSFKSGTAIRRVVLRDIKKFKILVPPLEEQKKIANILSSVDNKIQIKEEQKEKLQELKRGLMQQLLTGKTRVSLEN